MTLGIPLISTAETEAFWAAGAAGQLVVEQCVDCGLHIFPPRGICRRCHGRTLVDCVVTPPGEIYSYTVNQNAWAPDAEAVYTVGLVEFPDFSSIRFVGRVEGFDGEPTIGDRVNFQLRPAFGDRFQITFTPWDET